MKYNFGRIEKYWQNFWDKNKTFKAEINNKPKYYVMDMFPYPSGSGLHVGHPLGYIASDIISRFKKLKGYLVFLLSNMQLKPVNIQKKQLKKILKNLKSN